MRVAIYARYSSDNQRDASIEDQIRTCRTRIAQENWTLVATFTDHAMSGATTLRPGYQKLLEDARGNLFDVVLTEALDRLSRDQEDIAGFYKQMTFAGIRLVTLSEGDISELHVGLKGTMNALFLKDLAQKTWRGLEGRVRSGRSGGGLCYGYDVVRGGVDDRGGRVINLQQAAVVQRIFADFASGRSPRAIALALNQAGVPGPGNRPWGDSAIRGHHLRRTGILRNELYVGRLVWNRQRYMKDPRTGRRIARMNPAAQWIIQQVPDLRVLDDDLWDRVQSRLGGIRSSPAVELARGTRFWEQRRPRDLLTGLVRCGDCGGPLASIGRDYLGCSTARRQGTCSNRTSIRRGKIEALVLDGLRDRMMQPDAVAEFITAFHAEANRIASLRDQDIEQNRRALRKVQHRLDALLEAVADGIRHSGLQAKLDELETQRVALEASITSAPPPAPRFHPALSDLYRHKVEALGESLADPDIREEAVSILRSLIERVSVRTHGKGEMEVEIEGDIVKMIELPVGSGSSMQDVYRRSVKVVAGTRNQRWLRMFSAMIEATTRT